MWLLTQDRLWSDSVCFNIQFHINCQTTFGSIKLDGNGIAERQGPIPKQNVWVLLETSLAILWDIVSFRSAFGIYFSNTFKIQSYYVTLFVSFIDN